MIVPTHRGDLSLALGSLSKWPTTCSDVTLAAVDLVLYKAESEDESTASILSTLQKTAGRCFASTKIIFGNLDDEVRRRWPRSRELSITREFQRMRELYEAPIASELDVSLCTPRRVSIRRHRACANFPSSR